MKQIDNLMPLATLEDLRGFCLDYTRRDKKFGNELAKFLNERFIDDEDSAADFIARLEDAFGEEKNIGNRWHSYYVTNWDEVNRVSYDVLKDARRLLDMGNASAELLTEYVSMLKDYASRNMGARHYCRMRQSMEAMLKLNNGKTAAHQLAEHFREVYRRRPSFMAEISKF